MDAGCGDSINYRLREKFNYIRRNAVDHGVESFTLDTVEIDHTKGDQFDLFPTIHRTRQHRLLHKSLL